MNTILTAFMFVALLLAAFVWENNRLGGPASEAPAIEGATSDSLDDMLSRTSQALNEKLPMMVDAETRLDSTMGLSGTFRYNYTLIKHPASQINAWKLGQLVEPMLTNRVCSSKEMQYFLKNGVEISYAIYGNDGKQITVITVPPSACTS